MLGRDATARVIGKQRREARVIGKQRREAGVVGKQQREVGIDRNPKLCAVGVMFSLPF
jgi:hypothetical protein